MVINLYKYNSLYKGFIMKKQHTNFGVSKRGCLIVFHFSKSDKYYFIVLNPFNFFSNFFFFIFLNFFTKFRN